MKLIPYIAILILLAIIVIQNLGEKRIESNSSKIDTVIIYKTIHDTIKTKPILIVSKVDTTIWIRKTGNVPDTSYVGLLSQYKNLGNSFFSTNIFKTDFKIADYGSVSIIDTIRENKLIGTTIIENLRIPTTVITIEKESPAKNRLFVGVEFAGSKKELLSEIYGGLLLKTKKEKIYGASLGYNGEVLYKGSLYFPIKIK